jgi:hypothetical protein
MDIANCIADVVYRLGFQNATDLDAAGTWVTSTELYAWADEAVKAISYRNGVFVTLDASIGATAGTAVYQLPTTHVYTLQAWLASQELRLTPVRELRALDATWPVSTGPSMRCSFDAGSVGTITLYPNPSASGTLWQLCQEYPNDVALGASTILLPTPLQDYFSYAMLNGARGKESDGAELEMADHFEARVDLYDQIVEHLYGKGQ